MKARLLSATCATFALILAAPAYSQAPEYAQEQLQTADEAGGIDEPIWPFEASDLPLDTGYHVGVLDNGMRYIIRPNATPPEQGNVQMWVDFGSLGENDEQSGWAHFIEHMAFNGSTNVPEGEMVKLLEREGLAFGADTNASTGFDTTTYKLDLPRNDAELLDIALMLMRETASELLFDEAAVEREKGVILSERRVRDTYQLRSLQDNLEFSYPGSNIADGLPIGTIPTIEAATGAQMKALWQQYYRPENVAIIVVGDFDADAVEQAITERFGDWQAPARLEAEGFGPFDLEPKSRADIFIDPALSERVTISAIGPWKGGPDSVASRRTRVLQQIGYGIINRRLQKLARLEEPPFSSAGIGTSDIGEEARDTNLAVRAANGEWRKGLAATQEVYRRALEFGFSEAEVAEQTANLRSAIEANAAGESTRSNGSFITGAITLLRDGQVPTTPSSALERYNAHEPSITPETVLAALNEELVSLNTPRIRFEGRTLPEDGEEALITAWNEGMATEMVEQEQVEMAEFAYTNFGQAGEVTSDWVDERLGIREVVFANGLRLNLKHTDLQADRIGIQLSLDGGDMLNTRENPLATQIASSLPNGGLGAHTLDEVQTILAGRQVSFNVGSGPETFQMSARTIPKDLELQLQLFAATLTDPGYRPNAEAQFQRNVRDYFARQYATPGSALSTNLGAIVSDDDPRHSLQPQEEYLLLTFEKLRGDISDRLVNGAMEIALVGDFDEDEAIALVAKTLGALPAREAEFQAYDENRKRVFTQDRSPRTLYHDGAQDQASILMVWPTRDDSDQRASQTLELLERVMQLKLIDSLREELGQTYSPNADADQSSIHPDYGSFDISASIAADQVDATRSAMVAAINAMRDEAVSEDTLLRARAPLLESYDNFLDTNIGWMRLVDRAQSEGDRIDRYLSGRESLASITPEEIRAAAEQYLIVDEALEVVVLPRPIEGPEEGTQEDTQAE